MRESEKRCSHLKALNCDLTTQPCLGPRRTHICSRATPNTGHKHITAHAHAHTHTHTHLCNIATHHHTPPHNHHTVGVIATVAIQIHPCRSYSLVSKPAANRHSSPGNSTHALRVGHGFSTESLRMEILLVGNVYWRSGHVKI